MKDSESGRGSLGGVDSKAESLKGRKLPSREPLCITAHLRPFLIAQKKVAIREIRRWIFKLLWAHGS